MMVLRDKRLLGGGVRLPVLFGRWWPSEMVHASFVEELQSVSHVTRHTSHITHHTSHVTRHTSHVTRHTSHVTRHYSYLSLVLYHASGCFNIAPASHVTRHTSHVTRHTSHVTRHTSPQFRYGRRAVSKHHIPSRTTALAVAANAHSASAAGSLGALELQDVAVPAGEEVVYELGRIAFSSIAAEKV